MISLLKKLIPKSLLRPYHYLLAQAADFFYGSPADNLIVIGVTGTAGKSTVVYLISKILEKAGYKVGATSTIMFKADKKEWLNDKKMTMVGRLALQKLLRRMVSAQCQYAVIEVTSQGIEQYRHLGINFDVLVFTNLYPEHLEAHGGFENYKKAKLKLFAKLKDDSPKLIAGQKIKKTIIANLDDEYAKDFLQNWAEEKLGYAADNRSSDLARVVHAEKAKADGAGIEFFIERQRFFLPLLGRHNIGNVLAAVAVGLSQGLNLSSMAEGLFKFSGVPGRLEIINSGQPFGIIVDYAFEPKAVLALYETVGGLSHQKIIHILGSAGGGRDKARRPALGKIAGEKADLVIVTNEDPYDEDPQIIINQVAEGAISAGKVLDKNLFKILDRREAIAKALSLARAGDMVLITGKGSEQAIAVKGGKLAPWDDRTVVREELGKIARMKIE